MDADAVLIPGSLASSSTSTFARQLLFFKPSNVRGCVPSAVWSLSFVDFTTLPAFMKSSGKKVGCTAHEGAVWMHLDNVTVHIPSHLVKKSKVLMDALSSVCESSVTSGFTLDVPIEWMQAWVACCVHEEQQLGCEDSEILLNCVLVCFLPPSRIPQRTDSCFNVCSCSYSGFSFRSARLSTMQYMWCCSTTQVP
jgi:hypothetical protein